MPSHKQRSLFLRWRTKRQKRTKVVAQALAPDRALRKVGALCAIHKANVTVALLFQTLIKMKKGRPYACTRAALGTNRRSLGGVRGVRRIHGNKLGRVQLVPGMEKEILAAISTAMLRQSRGRPTSTPPGFILPCRPTVADRPPTGPGWVHELKHDGYRFRFTSATAGYDSTQ